LRFWAAATGVNRFKGTSGARSWSRLSQLAKSGTFRKYAARYREEAIVQSITEAQLDSVRDQNRPLETFADILDLPNSSLLGRKQLSVTSNQVSAAGTNAREVMEKKQNWASRKGNISVEG